MCCQCRLQHGGNACVKSVAAAQGCWTGRQRSERDEETACGGDKKERERINRARHRLTFSLVYLMMRTTVSCPVHLVISCWHQDAVLCCFTCSVSTSYILFGVSLSMWTHTWGTYLCSCPQIFSSYIRFYSQYLRFSDKHGGQFYCG